MSDEKKTETLRIIDDHIEFLDMRMKNSPTDGEFSRLKDMRKIRGYVVQSNLHRCKFCGKSRGPLEAGEECPYCNYVVGV